MSIISIVVLVHRRGIYLTVCTHNWSDEFNYMACNGNTDIKKDLSVCLYVRLSATR